MSAGAAPTYLAFDIGGTKVASGFVTLPANANAGADGRPEVTARCEIPTEAARGGEDLKNRIVAFAVRQLERAEAEGVIVMADCGSFADAERAVEAGTDIISTTLSGYTGERPKTDGPDFELLGQMIEAFPDVPVLCEGRIHTPDQLHQVMAAGAWAAVVGTAITHPTTITRWFEAKL